MIRHVVILNCNVQVVDCIILLVITIIFMFKVPKDISHTTHIWILEHSIPIYQ